MYSNNKANSQGNTLKKPQINVLYKSNARSEISKIGHRFLENYYN